MSGEMRKLMEHEVARLRREVEDGGEVMPHFLAWGRDGQMHYIATPWGSEDEKVGVLRRLSLFFAWKGVTQYIMASEAWVVVREAGSADHREPRLCEDRREVITLMGVSHTEVLGLNAHIIRDGSVVAVEEPQWHEGLMDGRMARLLPPPGLGAPPPHMEELLSKMFAGAQT